MNAHRLKAPYKPRWRQPRQKDTKYLKWIASLPCTVCGASGRTQAAHVRYSDLERGKRETGRGEKPDDKWAVPLCVEHHAEQHSTGEREWWESYGIDPLALCIELYERYQDG